jgi:AraC-like DNA-binding protein
MITQTYCTDPVPNHERFDYWREVLCRNFFGMTSEASRAERENFNGFMQVGTIGDSALIEVRSSPNISKRLDRDIADAVGNAFFVFMQGNGATQHSCASHNIEFVTHANALAVTHSDVPFVSQPLSGNAFHFRLVKFPFSRLQPGIERSTQAPPHPLERHHGVEPLLRAYFEAFFEAAPNLDGFAADVAVQTLANLAMLAYGVTGPDDEASREAVHRAKRQQVIQFIEQNLHDPELSPSSAARALGISVRQLHVLFEPTGASFSQQVRRRRLSRVRMMLTCDRAAKITDVAFACGFESASTFYRAFNSEFGLSPVEWRAAVGAADDH